MPSIYAYDKIDNFFRFAGNPFITCLQNRANLLCNVFLYKRHGSVLCRRIPSMEFHELLCC